MIRKLMASIIVSIVTQSASAQMFLDRNSAAHKEAEMVWDGKIPCPLSLAGALIYYDYNRNGAQGSRMPDKADGKLRYLIAIPVQRISDKAFIFKLKDGDIKFIAVMPDIDKLLPQGLIMNSEVHLISRYVTDTAGVMSRDMSGWVFHVVWAGYKKYSPLASVEY